MIDLYTLRHIILEIIDIHEYTLSGIASDLHIAEDVLIDIVSGVNANPSFIIAVKLFELHMRLFPDIYAARGKKQRRSR